MFDFPFRSPYYYVVYRIENIGGAYPRMDDFPLFMLYPREKSKK